MLHLFRRNPPQRILLHQITQNHLPFLPPNLITNEAAANPLPPFTLFHFSSAASKKLEQESPERKDPVLVLLETYGFTDIQLKRFRAPSVRNTEIIRAKLEYLLDFGFSPSELIRVICFCPALLGSSLKERIEPNLSLLEATFGSRKHIIKAVIHGPWLIMENIEKHVIPNLKILRESTVPTDKVIDLFTRYPRVLYKHPNVIIETITKLKGMGMSPSTVAFVHGMNAMIVLKKETWERKMELYRSFGWSEKDTLSAFSRHPCCMCVSEDKITKAFKFFMEKLHWDSALILRWPVVLNYSLNGRIIPRCAVLSVLDKNGLWNGIPGLYRLFVMAEMDFKERFVYKYEKDVPQVIDAYQGKIDFVGFESMVHGSHKS